MGRAASISVFCAGKIKQLLLDWRQMTSQLLYASILWTGEVPYVYSGNPHRAYDSRYLLICKHAFSEKIGKILILIPLSYVLYFEYLLNDPLLIQKNLKLDVRIYKTLNCGLSFLLNHSDIEKTRFKHATIHDHDFISFMAKQRICSVLTTTNLFGFNSGDEWFWQSLIQNICKFSHIPDLSVWCRKNDVMNRLIQIHLL